jgi:hypothetical protein
MTVIYQAKYFRQYRYKTHSGWSEYVDVPKPYWNSRKINKRVVVITNGFKLIIYPKTIPK